MVLVEDYSIEALSSVLAMLRERSRRSHLCKSFTISDKTIRTIIEREFGLNSWAAGHVRLFVTQYLVVEGVLTLKYKTAKYRVFNVHSEKLPTQ